MVRLKAAQFSRVESWLGLIAAGSRLLVVLAIAGTLAGCAGWQAYRNGNALLDEGKVEQGLEKLQQAVAFDPNNAEYRITLANRRASVINQLISAADAERREGRLTNAEKMYRQVQSIDPNNAMAQQSLEAMVAERRHRQIVVDAEAIFKKGSEADYAEALEKLRAVLLENPRQKDAVNLKARIDEARAKVQRTEAKLAAVFQKSITLEFRDAPLKSVLEVVAKVAGLNFFYDKDVRPDLKVTIFVRNTSIEDAMRLLLVTNQLEQKVLNGNSVLIYPSTPQKLKDYQTLAIRSFYLANADVKSVANTIKTIVKTTDMVVDERLGIIIMRDTPDAVRIAERIVALQDLSDPEVMLEVEVLEIKRSRLLELGIQWPSQLTLSPLEAEGSTFTLEDLGNLTESTTRATIGGATVNVRKDDQDANILANPRIRVRNKEKAKILIGDRVPVITTTSTSTGFVSESVNYVDVGLKLEVEPNVYLDEEVAIKINLEVSSLVREVVSKSGTLSYQIGTREANTVLRLRDGETQVLAGLINDEDRTTANKIPALGELPLIGRIFGSQRNDAQRSEILLSITPHVVRSIRRPDLVLAEFESGTGTSIGAQSLHLSTAEAAESEAEPTALSPPRPDIPLTAPIDEESLVTEGFKSGADSSTAAPSDLITTAPLHEPQALVAAAVPNALPSQTIGALSLRWQAPAQVRTGEQFSAVLQVNSQGPLRGLPLLIGYDPQALQVVNVQDGDFFRQSNGQASFNHRLDPAQGKIFVAAVRQSVSGLDAGVNGVGSIVTVTFKAVKAGDIPAKVRLLSVSPEPSPATPVAVPIEQLVRVVP